MYNFGMNWPTDNIAGTFTEEENRWLEPRRIETGPKFGGAYPEYLDILFWLCVKSGARRVVEIGAGHTTIPLLLACRRNGGTLFSTDIGYVDKLVKDVWKFPYVDNWTFKFGIDSVEMGRQWNSGEIDLIYLDTSHTYEQTSKEIEVWEPNLKVGGWLVFHDVQSCVTGVFRAISELIMRRAAFFEYHQYNIAAGFGILIKTEDYDAIRKR